MKILYLYAELMGYQIPIFKEYVEKYHADVHVVHWDHKKLTPYNPPKLENVTYYKRSEYTKHELIKLARNLAPDIAFISGWQDKHYLSVARYLRNERVPVVAGFDDQWKSSFRQRVASLIFPFTMKKYFSHSWVAGPYQYEYARRMGFKKHEIIFSLLSGNTPLFNKGIKYLEIKAKDYPKTFLYVGNFRSIKGTDILVDAFKKYRIKYDGNWELICIGNGDLRYLLENVSGIEVIDFTPQDKLVEITKRAGVFVLPSRFDQWGVVVHEFASAGMPLILSENVGASPTFLIEKFNGLGSKNNSSESLAKAMYVISNKSDSELIEMSKNSFLLSKKINPEIAAASFLSILK